MWRSRSGSSVAKAGSNRSTQQLICGAQISRQMPIILGALVTLAAPRTSPIWNASSSAPTSQGHVYPSEPMTMWPISPRVNRFENDDVAILEAVDEGGPELL